MPDMIPVGNTGIPPDPMKGINTLSGIIGIQQQRQTLQTGAIQQQTAQAESQQSQQKNRELQALSQFTSGAMKDPKYQNSDGSLNVQQFQNDALKVAPVYGPEQIGKVTSNAKEAIETRRTMQGLSTDQAKMISGGLMDEANDPHSTPTSLLNRISQLRSINPTDPNINRMLDNFLLGADRNNTQQTAAKAAATLGGISSKQPSTMDVGGAVQPGTTTAFGPGQGTFAPQGAPIKKVLGPAEQTPYLASAAAAREAGAGVTSIDLERAKEVGNLQQTSSANLELTKQIDRLSEDINSGKVAKMISETGNYLGLSSINQARSQLVKDLGQVRGAVAARAGSDAKAAEILEGYPNDTTPTQTTHAAMDYIRGTLRQNLSRGELLKQYQQQDPQSVRGFASADNILTRNTNPLMHEYMALQPAERAAFYKRNFGSAQEAQAFKDQVNAVQKHTSAFGQ